MEKERMDRIVEKVAGILDSGFENTLKERAFLEGVDYNEHLNRLRNLSIEQVEDLLNQRKAQIAELEAIKSKQVGNLRFMAGHKTKAEMNYLRRLHEIESEYLKKLKTAKNARRLKWILGGGAVLAAPFVLGGLGGKRKEVNNVYVVGSEPTQ